LEVELPCTTELGNRAGSLGSEDGGAAFQQMAMGRRGVDMDLVFSVEDKFKNGEHRVACCKKDLRPVFVGGVKNPKIRRAGHCSFRKSQKRGWFTEEERQISGIALRRIGVSFRRYTLKRAVYDQEGKKEETAY